MPGRKITLILEESDVELLVSALRVAGATKHLGRGIGHKLMPRLMPKLVGSTDELDAREKKLLEKLINEIGH